jgi:hypothetical protein
MKRFFHLFAVIALLLANAGTEVHANCFGAGCGGETTSSVSANHDHENVSSKQDSKGTCDTCLQHHHHTANIFPAIKPAYFMTSLHVARDWEAASLMPGQHYPPSKPPRV